MRTNLYLEKEYTRKLLFAKLCFYINIKDVNNIISE